MEWWHCRRPWVTPITSNHPHFSFLVFFDIFATVETGVIIFVQVGHIKYYPQGRLTAPKWTYSGHVTQLQFWGQSDYVDWPLQVLSCAFPPRGHVTSFSTGKWVIIRRKWYKIKTSIQWKTKRKLYVPCRMAPMPMTLNDLQAHFDYLNVETFLTAVPREL